MKYTIKPDILTEAFIENEAEFAIALSIEEFKINHLFRGERKDKYKWFEINDKTIEKIKNKLNPDKLKKLENLLYIELLKTEINTELIPSGFNSEEIELITKHLAIEGKFREYLAVKSKTYGPLYDDGATRILILAYILRSYGEINTNGLGYPADLYGGTDTFLNYLNKNFPLRTVCRTPVSLRKMISRVKEEFGKFCIETGFNPDKVWRSKS